MPDLAPNAPGSGSTRAQPAAEPAQSSQFKPAPPCTLVIFGAGGDLTKRLLMPSLYNLAQQHLLSDDFKIIGVDRVQQDDEAWRKALGDTMQSFTEDKTAGILHAGTGPGRLGLDFGAAALRLWRLRPGGDLPAAGGGGRRRKRHFLSRRRRTFLRHGGGRVGPGRPAQAGRRPVPPGGDREAVRRGPRLRPGAQRPHPGPGRREPVLPHRPLPR